MVQEEIQEEIFDKIKVGKRLLEAFTSELYDNIEYVIREYISNSIDAEATRIYIIADKETNNIKILDDGIGMTADQLDSSLDIMVSPKEGKKTTTFPPIGEIGIGMYSAGKICENIIIYSKKSGETSWHVQRIPIGQWMKDLLDKEKNYLQEIIISFKTEYKVSTKEEIKEQGTKIILQSVKPKKFDELFSRNFFLKLSRIIPVSFGTELDKLKVVDYLSNEDIEGLIYLKEELRSIFSGEKFGEIAIDNENFIPLNYNHSEIYFTMKEGESKNTYQLTKPVPDDEILSPKYFFHTKKFVVDGEFIGVGWAVFRGPTKKVAAPQFSNFYFRGIIVRLYNVLIYEAKDVWDWAKTAERSLKSHPLDNIWGEILLYSPKLSPKSSRTAIRENNYWVNVRKTIAEWLIEIADEGEKQRKISQKAKRFYDLYINNVDSKIIPYDLNLQNFESYIEYNDQRHIFLKNTSIEDSLAKLISKLIELISNFDEIYLINKKELDQISDEELYNEIPLSEKGSSLHNLETIIIFLGELEEGVKEFEKKGHLKESTTKNIIKKLRLKISSIINNIKMLLKSEKDRREIIEKRKIEEEKRKDIELKKHIEEMRKEVERKELEEEKRKLEAEKKQIEIERKRFEEVERKELEEEKRKLEAEKKQIEIERKRLEEEARKKVGDEKRNLEAKSKMTRDTGRTQGTVGVEEKFIKVVRNRERYMQKKTEIALSDIKKIIPKMFESNQMLLELLVLLGNWVLSNTTLDKFSVINGFQLIFKNIYG